VPTVTVWPIEPSGGDDRYHLSNLAIEEHFFVARNRYMESLDVDQIWDGPVVPLLREILTRFEAEASHHDRLAVTTSVASRSRRSFVMDQRLLRGDVLIATCRSVHVCVDRLAGSATAIPEDLWAAIERLDAVHDDRAHERPGP
jgi:acyl-CoA thioesterase FadM